LRPTYDAAFSVACSNVSGVFFFINGLPPGVENIAIGFAGWAISRAKLSCKGYGLAS
jgi:hypothetical protein